MHLKVRLGFPVIESAPWARTGRAAALAEPRRREPPSAWVSVVNLPAVLWKWAAASLTAEPAGLGLCQTGHACTVALFLAEKRFNSISGSEESQLSRSVAAVPSSGDVSAVLTSFDSRPSPCVRTPSPHLSLWGGRSKGVRLRRARPQPVRACSPPESRAC